MSVWRDYIKTYLQSGDSTKKPRPTAPSKTKKKKEVSKTTDKSCKPQEENDTLAPGCNCPLGCFVGEAVTDEDDVVQLECSSPACTKDLRVHAMCYENWESELVKMVEKTNRRGGWRASWVRQHLWTPTCMRHLTSEFTKCQCGGQLVRQESINPVNKVILSEKPAKRAKHHVPGGIKKLPVLRSDVKVVGTGARHRSQISNSLTDESDQLQEKRKYPVGLTIEPKKKYQSKASNGISGKNTIATASSLCTGERSRISSVCPSDEGDHDLAQQIAVLNMFKLRHETERSGWEQVRSGSAAGMFSRSAGSGGIKIAGGKFHALISDDSDVEPADALGGKNVANRQSSLNGDSASVISAERPTYRAIPKNTTRVDHYFDSHVASSSGYNDIDQFYGFYDISKHCIIADTDPFAYSRDSARLSAVVRQMCITSPIPQPRIFR